MGIHGPRLQTRAQPLYTMDMVFEEDGHQVAAHECTDYAAKRFGEDRFNATSWDVFFAGSSPWTLII